MTTSDLLFRFLLGLAVAQLPACMLIPAPSAGDAGIGSLERTTYRSDGRDISVLSAGDETAPRLIYVHGSPGDAESWADYLVRPIPGTYSMAVDRPGFGQSHGSGTVRSLAGQAQALEPLLVQQAGRWPVLVGHSLGGPIVLQAAADFPDRVGGLVIVAGSVDPSLERLRWYNYLAKALAWILPRDLTRSNQEMWSLDQELDVLAAQLDQVRCPVWIVHGGQDSLVPVANVSFLQARIRQTETSVFEEAGHFLIWQEPWKSYLREVLIHMVAQDRS